MKNIKEIYNDLSLPENKIFKYIIFALLFILCLTSFSYISSFFGFLLGIFILFFFFASFPFILILITIIASFAILSDSIFAFLYRPSREQKIIDCVTGLKFKGLYEDEKLKEMCYSIK